MFSFVEYVGRQDEFRVEGTLTCYFQDNDLLHQILDERACLEAALRPRTDTAVGRFMAESTGTEPVRP